MTTALATDRMTTKTAQAKARKPNASILAAGELVDRLTAAFRAQAEGYAYPDCSDAGRRAFKRRNAAVSQLSAEDRRALGLVCASLDLVASRPVPRTKGSPARV